MYSCLSLLFCSGAAPWRGVLCEPGRLATGKEETHRENPPHLFLVWLEQYQRYCNAHLRPDWVCPRDHGKVGLRAIYFNNSIIMRCSHTAHGVQDVTQIHHVLCIIFLFLLLQAQRDLAVFSFFFITLEMIDLHVGDPAASHTAQTVTKSVIVQNTSSPPLHSVIIT